MAEPCDPKVNVDDGFLNLMTPDGASKDDVKVPEGEIGVQISTGFDEGKDLLVTIVSAMGEEQVSLSRSRLHARLSAWVGYFVQGSPERLLVLTLAHPVVISRPSLVHLHFYALSFYVLTDVILLCMYFSWLDSACVLHSPLLRYRNE